MSDESPVSPNQVSVSVVIPCFRCAETIGRAVDSIARQTYLPTELILVDDCSPDDGQTLERLKKIKDEFGDVFRVTILELPFNCGPGGARNEGWSIASSSFIGFLDADDAWHYRKLEFQYLWMESNPEVVFTCHDIVIHHYPKCIDSDVPEINEKNLTIWPMLLKNMVKTSSVLVRADMSERFPSNLKHAEDYNLWLRVLCLGRKAVKLCAPLAFTFKHRYAPGGLTGDLRLMHLGVESCFLTLYKTGYIPLGAYLMSYIWEKLKYIRRVVQVCLKNF